MSRSEMDTTSFNKASLMSILQPPAKGYLNSLARGKYFHILQILGFKLAITFVVIADINSLHENIPFMNFFCQCIFE